MIPESAAEAAWRKFAELADPLGKWEQQAESCRAIYRQRETPDEAVIDDAELDSWDDGDETVVLVDWEES